RPRATRSSVQKSPTVTTGFARPIVGKMLGPWTRAPIGHRRYSRRESGSRNVTLARSANPEGELSVDMDAHLLRDLGPLVIHDDDVPLPVFRCLAAAQRALVLVGHVTAILARLRNLYDHGSAFPLPHAAFRPRAVLFDPVELPERRLTHREADLRLPRRPFVQGHRDDARPDLVADPVDVVRDQREGLVRPDLAFQRGARELPGDRVDVLPESLRRDPDDVFPLDPLVHENPPCSEKGPSI